MNQRQALLLVLICGVFVKECTCEINWVISDAIRGAWEQQRSKNAGKSDEIVLEETEEVEDVPLIRGPCFTKCSIAVEDRRRCTYTGTIKSKCIRKKCCWDDDESVADDKRCYRKEIGICDNPKCLAIDVKQRVTCLAAATNPNVTREKASCIRAECCWDETVGSGMCYDMKTTKSSKKIGAAVSAQEGSATMTSSVLITSTEIPVINNITTSTTPLVAANTSVSNATDAVAFQDIAATEYTTTQATTPTKVVQATTSTDVVQATTTTEAVPVATTTEAVQLTTTTEAVQATTTSTEAVQATTTTEAVPVATTTEAVQLTTTTEAVQATTSTEAVQSTTVVPTTLSGSRFQVTVSTLFPDFVPTSGHNPVSHTRPQSRQDLSMFGGHQTTFPQLSVAVRPTGEVSSSTHHPVRSSIAPMTSISASNEKVNQDQMQAKDLGHTDQEISFQHRSTTIPPLFPNSVKIEDKSSVKTGMSNEPDPMFLPWSWPEQKEPYILPTTISPLPYQSIAFSTNPVVNWISTTPKPSVFFVPTSTPASNRMINPPVKDSDLVTYNTATNIKTVNPLAQQVWSRNLVFCMLGEAKLCKLSIIHGMSIKPTNQHRGVTRQQPITGQQGQTDSTAHIASQPIAKKSQKPVDDFVPKTEEEKTDYLKTLCKLVDEMGLEDKKWKVTCRALKVAEEAAKKPLPSVKDIERGMLSAPGISAGSQGGKPPAISGKGRNVINLLTSNNDVCLQQRLFQTGINYPIPCYTSELQKVDSEATCLSLGCCWRSSMETIVLDRLNMPHNKLTSYILSNTIGFSDDDGDHEHCIKPLSTTNIYAMYWMSYTRDMARLQQEQQQSQQAGISKVDETSENASSFPTPQTSSSYGCDLLTFGIHVSCGDDITDMDSCFARSCCWFPQFGDEKTKCFLPKDASR